MNKLGLVGKNISFSRSPKLHNIIKDIYNFDLTYELIDIDENMLEQYLNSSYTGFNITKPYKEVMFRKDFIHSEIVLKTQALNTIYFKDNKIYSDNTDYYGFEYLIKYYNININNKKVAILGTGGSAKMLKYFFSKYTNDVTLVSRSNKGQSIINYDEILNNSFDIIVNATPIGTGDTIELSPLSKEQVGNAIVIDLNYNPSITKIMSYANESYNGLIMLIVQGLYSQKHWQNQDFDITDELVNKIKERMLNV